MFITMTRPKVTSIFFLHEPPLKIKTLPIFLSLFVASSIESFCTLVLGSPSKPTISIKGNLFPLVTFDFRLLFLSKTNHEHVDLAQSELGCKKQEKNS